MDDIFKGQKGVESARSAIDEMVARQIPVTHENYAVWLAHCAGTNPELSSKLIAAINDPVEPMTDVTAKLYEIYFNARSMKEEVLATSTKMSKELNDALATLGEVGQSTKAYGEALQLGSDELDKAKDSPAAMAKVIQSLTSATREMSERAAHLESRLEETTKEVHTLRSGLELIQREALTDGLTGLANRRRFDQLMDEATTGNGWTQPLCLMMVDIDHFKRVNDTWGHQTGDQIIRFVAGVLTKFADTHHVCARYGGEEFAVIMPATPQDEAESVAEEIRQFVERKKLKRRSTDEELGKVTVSIGIAHFEDNETPGDLIERADKALYASKQNGRNRTTVAAPAQKAAHAA